MNLLLNFGFAWIAVILSIILAVVYLTRKFSKGDDKLANSLKVINKKLRKYHKELGILLILTGFIHGYFSSDEVLSLNMGTISWVVSILLGINYMLRKYLSKFRGWMYYHRVLTAAFIGTIIIHVVNVGGIQAPYILQSYFDHSGETVLADSSVKDIASNFEGVTFKDGVYEGEATGYRAGLKVSVTVSSNKITEIKVTEHNEVNARFYQKPINTIPQAIIDSQSLDVDAVSGATRTSVGIINAVNNALSKAVISGSLPEQKEQPQGGHGSGKGDRFREGNEGLERRERSLPSGGIDKVLPSDGIEKSIPSGGTGKAYPSDGSEKSLPSGGSGSSAQTGRS